jgi:lipopolysaccharide heptosyltransferase I
MDGPFRRIALVRLTAFGDVVFALPTVAALRRAFPAARIVWIVEERLGALPRATAGVDHVLPVPLRAFREEGASPARRWRALKDLGAAWRDIRAERFDLAVDLQGNLKSGFVVAATGAATRLGLPRGTTKEPNWWFTNRRPTHDATVRHRALDGLRLLEAIGVRVPLERPAIALPPSALAEADRFLRTARRNPGPTVVIHPGTSRFMPHKRWPAERFGALSRALVERAAANVFLTSGPDDGAVVQAVLAAAAGAATAAPPLPDPLTLAAFLSRADLVVGGDTGPVHLADALGRSAVVLFGPTDPRLYHPLERPERVLFEKAPCSPCRFRECPERICLDAIDVERATALCLKTLDGTPIRV